MRSNNSMPRQNIWKVVRAAAAASLLAMLATVAAAQDYPTQPVHLIVPLPPGGPSDIVARLLGQKLSEVWGQPVIVENKPGAQSIIGTEYVSRASPDGYTLLMLVDSTVTSLPFRKEKVPYNPKSLTPITTLFETPMILVASSNTKAESLADFVRIAKTKPGQMNVAISTFVSQLLAVQFSTLAQIRPVIIPYKSVVETAQAVIAGDVDMAVTAYTTVQSYVGTGKINILAATGKVRNPAMPTVPTFSELGYPGFEYGVWIGLAAPAATPDSIIQKLSSDVSRIMAMPDIIARIKGIGSNPFPGNPSGTAELIRTESEKWKEVVPALD